MGDGHSIREEPGNLLEHAAAAALRAVREVVEAGDAKVEHVIILVYAGGVPRGEQDACSVMEGFDDSRDAAAFLMAHAIDTLRAHGMNVALVPVDDPRAN